MAEGKQTKVMQQHAAAKQAYPDAILFFRLGDFYEMFGQDAVLVSRLLNLTLTSRNKGAADEVPMAGVPHHAAHGYIGRLLKAGHRVAICEQMADPKTVKGIVPREVVRVLTPGLITADDHLERTRNNWLASVSLGPNFSGVALLDISTGELRAAVVQSVPNLLSELAHEAPSEILIASLPKVETERRDQVRAALELLLPKAAITEEPSLDQSDCEQTLGVLFREATEDGLEVSDAVARVLAFARRCNPESEVPVVSVARWDPSAALIVDASAERHLELVHSNSQNAKATLLSVLDATRTAQGARLLRRRLLAPLCDVESIRRRHDRVQVFLDNPRLRGDLFARLDDVSDFERIVSRCQLGQSSPRDLGSLRTGLIAAQRSRALLETLGSPAARDALGLDEPMDLAEGLREELEKALVERPPPTSKEGAIFVSGYDTALSEFERMRTHGSELVVELEARLKEQTSISGLKVRFTRVFGWYVEVNRSSASKVPKVWRRKQTVATGERFTLDELDELAERIASAEDSFRVRELELLNALIARVARSAEVLRRLARVLSEWDVDAALAEIAHRYDFCRPEVEEGARLEISEGRHPVVERLAAAGRFVPNDATLDANDERMWILTGPNMAGKSTFLRQVALIVIMAQMGSFVPAKSARIGLCDRVLSRVGASDNLAEGHSTFMVEMRETADILRYATPRSLVILDEIGRGTSTFDGLSIAWAVAEHLAQNTRCRTLFATHYHELTRLADESEAIANYSVSAREQNDDVVFLHRLVKGAASRSYGISVAKLAGLPEVVLARARALLQLLEGDASKEREAIAWGKRSKTKTMPQLSLFGSASSDVKTEAGPSDVLDTLRLVDVDRLSPLDALQLLVKLKKRL